MSGGTGVSSLGAVIPHDPTSSLLKSAYPIDLPHSLGGETHLYESRGGWIPRNSANKESYTPHTMKSPPKNLKKPKNPKKPHTKSPKSPKHKTKGGKKTKSRKNRTRKNFQH